MSMFIVNTLWVLPTIPLGYWLKYPKGIGSSMLEYYCKNPRGIVTDLHLPTQVVLQQVSVSIDTVHMHAR